MIKTYAVAIIKEDKVIDYMISNPEDLRCPETIVEFFQECFSEIETVDESKINSNHIKDIIHDDDQMFLRYSDNDYVVAMVDLGTVRYSIPAGYIKEQYLKLFDLRPDISCYMIYSDNLDNFVINTKTNYKIGSEL
jgi:hypothetical protein